MENWIPEQVFSTSETPAEGISAAKALALASNQGQRILVINNGNAATSLSLLVIDSAARQEIASALAANKHIVAHEKPLDVNGWKGSGYIIIDPTTGAGAYKISGGNNGSALTIFLGALSGFFDGFTRFKDHWFNAGNAPKYAAASGFLTVIAAVISVVQIVMDDSLSVWQKIGSILINIGAAIGMVMISSAIMATPIIAASSPILLGLLIASIAIAVSILTAMLVEYLIGYQLHRRSDYRNGFYA